MGHPITGHKDLDDFVFVVNGTRHAPESTANANKGVVQAIGQQYIVRIEHRFVEVVADQVHIVSNLSRNGHELEVRDGN